MDTNTEDQAPKPRSRRVPKRWLVLAGIVLILAIGLRITLAVMDRPSSGRIVVGSGKPAANDFEVSLKPQSIQAKTVSFSYPNGMSQQTPSPLVGPDIEKLSFSARDISTWNLRIDVTNDGQQPLSSDSGYTYRRQHPDMYQVSSRMVDGQPAVIMTDKLAAGFSEVAFLQHASYRATVSLSGDDPSGVMPLQTAFSLVLNSWQWQ